MPCCDSFRGCNVYLAVSEWLGLFACDGFWKCLSHLLVIYLSHNLWIFFFWQTIECWKNVINYLNSYISLNERTDGLYDLFTVTHGGRSGQANDGQARTGALGLTDMKINSIEFTMNRRDRQQKCLCTWSVLHSTWSDTLPSTKLPTGRLYKSLQGSTRV